MRSSSLAAVSRLLPLCTTVLVALALTGCGTLAGGLRATPIESPTIVPSQAPASTGGVADAPPSPGTVSLDVAPPSAEAAEPAAALHDDADVEPMRLAAMQTAKPDEDEDEYDIEDYDPREPFNAAMFEFNLKLDRHILKPVAKVYDKIVPDEIQRMIVNAFDNLGSIKRLVNSLLQATAFSIRSTVS